MKITKEVLLYFDEMWNGFWCGENSTLDWRTVAELFFIYGYKYGNRGRKHKLDSESN